MNNQHRPIRRLVSALSGLAVIATLGLVLAPAAAAAPGAGDWGTDGYATRLPGSSGEGKLVNECLSDGGCDYSPDLAFTDNASNGGSFTPGTTSLSINNEGTIGTCTATTATVRCVITETGHVANGVKIQTGDIAWQVADDAPTNTQVFNPGTEVAATWTGNDPDNDTYPVYTAGGGDWGTDNSGVRAPGDSGTGALVNQCQSDDGCDYSPDLTFTDNATNGGSFTEPGTSPLTIAGEGTVGTCTVTTSTVRCVITERGHVAKGTKLQTASIAWHVADDAAPEALVFEPGTHVADTWIGNDPADDVYPVYTPPEAGTPMADRAIAGGIGAAGLFGYAGLLLRRRRRTDALADQVAR